MGSHPLNLALRFLLEMAALVAIGMWGWSQHTGPTRWLWTIGLPVVAAVVWGTFAVPNDPSRSGQAPIVIPGALRLVLELAIFAIGVIALIANQYVATGVIMAAVTVLHYMLSYDRVRWLLRR
jgi:hypothetical protein